MQTTNTTAKTTQLPVSLQQAKDHLRVVNESLDSEIQLALEAAVEYCENVLGRSLRVSHTVVQSYDGWPCDPVRFDRQPAYSISHVKYYDTDNVLQTVTSTSYRLHASANAAAWMEFDSDYTFPSVYARSDAVQVTYLAGYSAITDVPKAAVWAILLYLEAMWGDAMPAAADRIVRSVDALLASIDPGLYR